MAGTLEFNHAINGLFPIYAIWFKKKCNLQNGFKFTELSQERDRIFAVYVFLLFHTFFHMSLILPKMEWLAANEISSMTLSLLSWKNLISFNDACLLLCKYLKKMLIFRQVSLQLLRLWPSAK
jgi:hypothetical protein